MSKSQNRITLLIPCYNKEKYLFRFFKTILKQKDHNFDILFLDDHSTDSSLKMLKEFQKQYQHQFNISILALEKNGGIANARNQLIKNVKTEYFLFVDPDDFLKPNALKLFNEKINLSNYQVVVSKNSFIWNGKIILPNVLSSFAKFKKRTKELDNMPLAWVENTSPFTWNKAINTKWFNSLKRQFCVGRSYEDMLLMNLTILDVEKMAYIDKTTYRYDVNMDGLSRVHNPKKFSDIFLNLIVLYESLETNNKLIDWQTNSQAEMKMLSKLFIHLFVKKQNNRTLKLFEQYLPALDIMFPFLEKYNIVNKLHKYKHWWSFVLKDSLKNFQKIKLLYEKSKK